MAKTDSFSARSYFCVLNHPEKLFGEIAPHEMVEQAVALWCIKPQRTCAINYEIGDSGTPHMHMVLEDTTKPRFSAVKKIFPGIHVEPTRGSKKDAEDYIHKIGKFEEKNHTIVVEPVYHGEITSNCGKRSDLDLIAEFIAQDMNPNEIMDLNIHFRQYESLIRKTFFAKRKKETPLVRDISVYWHVGDSGSGKSYTYKLLCDKHGADNVYLMTDYSNGGFDLYIGEPILFLDEFKGNMPFQQLLNYLDRYRIQLHCRYANSYALWTEVHITSIYPPEQVYTFMVEPSQRDTDRISQLMRRLTQIIYHYRTASGEYRTYSLPADAYITYEDLKKLVLETADFNPLDSLPEDIQLTLPF